MAYQNSDQWQSCYAPPPGYPPPQLWFPRTSRYPDFQSTLPLRDSPNLLLESSPFRPHLDTNYVPNSEEIAALHTALAQIQPEIDAANREIAQLEQEMSRILHQNALRQEYVAKHKALLTPIRHTPVEILQEIFYHVVYEGRANPACSMHKDDAPMVLTRVCRTWREVALQTPVLWASLHISVPHDPEPGTALTPLRVLGVGEWIRRSGSVPLTISIFQEAPALIHSSWGGLPDPDMEVGVSASLKQIIQSIRPSAHRWRLLCLGIPLISILPFLDIPASELVTLEEFSFNNLSGSAHDSHSTTLRESLRSAGLVRSPSLSRLHLLNHTPETNPLPYSLNWEHITHLTIDSTTAYPNATNTPRFKEYYSLLERIQQNIEYLSLSVRSPYANDEQTSTDPQPVVMLNLPRLKQLIVREQGSPCPAFGSAIRCPALEILEYHELAPLQGIDWVDDEEGSWTPPHDSADPSLRADGSLGTILSHSGASIKTLVTNPYVFSNEMIIRYLSYAPLLEVVRFTIDGVYTPRRTMNHGEILKALVRPFPNPEYSGIETIPPFPTAGSNVLCPLLNRIEWPNTSVFTIHEFLEFIELKQGGSLEGVAKLTRIVIHLDSMVPEEKWGILDRSFPSETSQCWITYDPPMIRTGSMLRDGLLGGPLGGRWA